MLDFIGNPKNQDNRNFLEKAASFLFGNTLKAVNTVGDTVNLAYDVGRQHLAQATHNQEAAQNADIAAQNASNRFKNTGGLFDAGTFYKDPQEASKPISFKEAAKKAAGATIGIGTEILPFAKGAGLGVKGAEEASKLSRGEQFAQNLIRSAGTGAAYGAAGGAGQDLLNKGQIDPADIVKSAFTSALLGGAGYTAGRGAGEVIKGGRAVKNAVADSIDNHPSLQALNDHYQTLQVAYDNANTNRMKTVLNKAMADNRAQYRAERKQISEGGYIKNPLASNETPPPEQPQSGAKKAMDVLAPAPEKTQPKTADITLEPQKPATIQQALAGEIQKGTGVETPQNIQDALANSRAVSTPSSKSHTLEAFRDPTAVLGSHFGEVGSTAAYKLQQGAKVVSDLEEAIRPEIRKSQQLLNKIAKTDVGKADVQSRIYNALEDRANVDKYLHTPQEKELFQNVQRVLDFYKGQRESRGLGVLTDYSPRTQVKDALDAPDRLLQHAKQAFSPNVQSEFSKTRINDLPDSEINKRIVELLPHYASSQAKEFGYTDAMNYIKDNLKNVNPAYVTDQGSRRQGEKYLQTLMTQILQPTPATKFERLQNKALAQTYKSALGFSPKFAAQNLTQRYATRSQVSKEAVKLVGKMDKADLADLRKEITTGYNPILTEMDQGAESVGGKLKNYRNLDPGVRVEKGNVGGAFDRGAAQAIVESDAYKAAIKDGLKPKEAAKQALADQSVRDLAVRRGNMVVNTTQFGGNFAAKPEFLRDSGSFLGLSKRWYQQYQRFPTGMLQLMGNIVKPTEARANDILRRGDPRQTPIVDYWKATKSYQAGVDDLIKGIKKGEVKSVSLQDAKNYKSLLDEAAGNLEKQMKDASQIRAGKTAKNIAKMWAAASIVQFLFDGGTTSSTAQKNGTGAEVSRSVQFGAPINIPTKNQNPLAGARIPSSPAKTSSPYISGKKLLDFVPVVGPAVNRGRDINKLITALTGSQ